MSFSDYLEQVLQKHWLKIATYTPPTNLYLGLSTADPGEAGAGLAEPSGSGYARVAFNSWTWNAGAGRAESSATATFPTATGSWGTITHLCIFDASTAGNLLASGALAASKTVNNGDTLSFPSAQITSTLD